jgi:hypothetical protein
MKQPLDENYSSPFDRPVKPRALNVVPFYRRPIVRLTYWVVCLVLIGALLWYIRSVLGGFYDSLGR